MAVLLVCSNGCVPMCGNDRSPADSNGCLRGMANDCAWACDDDCSRNWDMIFEAIFIGYLFVINLFGFIIMGVDKKRAIRGAWRISEASLFMTALLGGALGCTLGMNHFRHKTKHWYFKYGMPAIFAVQLCLVIFLTFNAL